MNMCVNEGYFFVDNSSIGTDHLRDDGLHLNDLGINILANNFINAINSLT